MKSVLLKKQYPQRGHVLWQRPPDLPERLLKYRKVGFRPHHGNSPALTWPVNVKRESLTQPPHFCKVQTFVFETTADACPEGQGKTEQGLRTTIIF